MNYMLRGLGDANDCREVVGTGEDGKNLLLGYVIFRSWAFQSRWYAYTIDSANDLVFQGRYRTADEAAAAVGRSYSEPGKVGG